MNNTESAMRYFIRAVKYFIYFCLLTTLIVCALVLIGAVEGNINSIFEGGYEAVWKIAAFFIVVSAIYPKLGFGVRDVDVKRDWDEFRTDAIEFFREKGYIMESESPEKITFRLRNTSGRLSKMFEDRITLTRSFYGYEFEGLRKDVLRLAAGFESRFSTKAED